MDAAAWVVRGNLTLAWGTGCQQPSIFPQTSFLEFRQRDQAADQIDWLATEHLCNKSDTTAGGASATSV